MRVHWSGKGKGNQRSKNIYIIDHCFFSKLIIEILMMIVYLRIRNHILRILKQRLLKQSWKERARDVTVSLFHLLNTRPSAV